MRVVYNNSVPFKGFAAINICGVLFVRKGVGLSDRLIRHESIHTLQMKELLYIGFYLLYVTEWLIQGAVWLFNKEMKPYHFITFEQEAYDNQDDLTYLLKRKPYAWIKYIGKWVKY